MSQPGQVQAHQHQPSAGSSMSQGQSQAQIGRDEITNIARRLKIIADQKAMESYVCGNPPSSIPSKDLPPYNYPHIEPGVVAWLQQVRDQTMDQVSKFFDRIVIETNPALFKAATEYLNDFIPKMYGHIRSYLKKTYGSPISPLLLREIARGALIDGLLFHTEEEPLTSSSQDADAGAVDVNAPPPAPQDRQQGTSNTSASLRQGKGSFTMVSLDHTTPAHHPDIAKIADDKFEELQPYIRKCMHPAGRRVGHFRHELLLDMVNFGIHWFLQKFPHLRNHYNIKDRLSRLIIASNCGIVSFI